MAKTTKKAQPAVAAVAKTKRSKVEPPAALQALTITELDEALEQCKKLHEEADAIRDSSRKAFWAVMAAAYFWWRAMGATKEKPLPAYLVSKCKSHKPEIDINENKGRLFTPVVKLAFRLTEADQAGRVSKYALVLEYIDRHFGGRNVGVRNAEDVERFKSDIVASIREEGGIVACEKDQRTFLSSKRGGAEKADAKKERDRLIVQKGAEAFLNQTSVLATARGQFVSTPEPGLVLLMGRHDGAGNVHVLSVVDTDDVEISRYIATSRAYSIAGVDPIANLFGNALLLSRAIEEHKSLFPTEASADPKAKSTQFKTCIRTLVLQDPTTGGGILVSLNRTTVAPVIQIRPTEPLSLPHRGDVRLRPQDWKALDTMIASFAARRIYSTTVVPQREGEESLFSIAFADGVRKDPRRAHFYEYDVGSEAVVCVDDNYKFEYAAEYDLDRLQLQELWENFVRPYKKDQAKRNPAVAVSMFKQGIRFQAGSLKKEFRFKPTTTSPSKGSAHDVALKGHDLTQLVDVLRSFRDLTTVRLAIDSTAAVVVTFDLLGAQYRVTVPVLIGDQQYNTRAFKAYAPATKVIWIDPARKGRARRKIAAPTSDLDPTQLKTG